MAKNKAERQEEENKIQHTRIEWVRNPDGSQGYTINPVKGLCPMACPYCYARRMYKRFKWNPRLRYDPSAWLGLGSLRKPSRIFVGSTMEIFHHRMNPKWLKWIMEVPLEFPQHTFIFLTKCPQNLIKWSPFPENCWVGVTATDYWKYVDACNYLSLVQAKVKFLSLEPLLSWDDKPAYFFYGAGINWFIIGQQTPVSAKTEPKIEWVREIVEAADKAGVKVFLKNNLESLLPLDSLFYTQVETNGGPEYRLRQELPGD